LIEEDLITAEKKFIKVISLDPQNRTAYQNLGEIYLKQKNYPYALETFRHLLNLDLKELKLIKEREKGKNRIGRLNEINFRIAETYFKIAEIYQLTEENKKAEQMIKRALTIAPNNPRYLDFFCEICIMLGNKPEAEECLRKLKDVNPENQKIEELEERVRRMGS